jgi:hypothetical protein
VYHDAQQFSEFEMNRQRSGALRAIGRNERGFPTVHFMGKGIDLFESTMGHFSNAQPPRDSAALQNEMLKTCFECHSSRGVFSVLCYAGFFAPPPSQQPSDLVSIAVAREATAVILWKQRQYDWGLLQGLWNQVN